ncbi:dephospho-CoA kinase [Cupriavidus basilensis]
MDRVLVVDCSEATQVARVMARQRLQPGQVEPSWPGRRARGDRLAAADDVIDNDGPPEALPAQVDRLDQLYRGPAAG